MPLYVQIQAVTYRIFQQYWRMPEYVLAKWALGLIAGLFIGFTYYGADETQAGMGNVIYSVFMLTIIFTSLVQQVYYTAKPYKPKASANIKPDTASIRYPTGPLRSP